MSSVFIGGPIGTGLELLGVIFVVEWTFRVTRWKFKG